MVIVECRCLAAGALNQGKCSIKCPSLRFALTSYFASSVTLPIALLALSAILSLTSALAFRNHQTLSATVGPSGLAFSRSKSRSTQASLLGLVANPFTLTILLFSVGLFLSALTIPGYVSQVLSISLKKAENFHCLSVQLAPLDKVVALLQSIAMFYIAYPAAVATGQVLLQTSPVSESSQMAAFASGLRDVSTLTNFLTTLGGSLIWCVSGGESSFGYHNTATTSLGAEPSSLELFDYTFVFIATSPA